MFVFTAGSWEKDTIFGTAIKFFGPSYFAMALYKNSPLKKIWFFPLTFISFCFSEPGDLVFEAGEQIEVFKKENEWWTGKIGDRSGVFPYNYVEPAAGVPAGGDPVGDPVPTGGNASETNGDEAEPIYSEPVAETVRTFWKLKDIFLF